MPRNVVLLCLDSLRKDYYDEYTPRLQQLTDISYEQCRAASSWSVPSHASIFTGELPHSHGIHAFNMDFSTLSRDDTFLTRLPAHHTIGVSTNIFASSAYGFDTWFDEFVDISPERPFDEGLDVVSFGANHNEQGFSKQLGFLKEVLDHQHPLQSLGNGVVVQLDNLTERTRFPKLLDYGGKPLTRNLQSLLDTLPEPFFVFANYMDVHGPHRHVHGYNADIHGVPSSWSSNEFDFTEINLHGPNGHESDIENIQQLYAAEADYLDRIISELIGSLQEKTDRETTVIITADHGENLGYAAEDFQLEHTGSLSEALLHVPLAVVNSPEWFNPDEHSPFSHLDLPDLIVGLAHNEEPDIEHRRCVAERVGSLVPEASVSLTDQEEKWLTRMMRTVYDEDCRERVYWDSLDESCRYRLDPERPNWEEVAEENVAVNDLQDEFFDANIQEYWNLAREAERDQCVNSDVEDRLSDLGYM